MKNVFVQQTFPRLYEIYILSDQQKQNNCLSNLSELNPDSVGNSFYEYYENLFQRIDQRNWEMFKEKLSGKVFDTHNKAKISIKGKKDKEKYSPIYPRLQGFNYFNEVHGYLYLKDRMHCEEVMFLQESDQKTPDLKGTSGTSVTVLEVKTINTSDDLTANFEWVAQELYNQKTIDLNYPKSANENLTGLKTKIRSSIEHAKGQMVDCHGAQKIVLFVIDLDSTDVREGLRQYLKEVDESHKELKIVVAGLQSLWRPDNKDFEWLYNK